MILLSCLRLLLEVSRYQLLAGLLHHLATQDIPGVPHRHRGAAALIPTALSIPLVLLRRHRFIKMQASTAKLVATATSNRVRTVTPANLIISKAVTTAVSKLDPATTTVGKAATIVEDIMGALDRAAIVILQDAVMAMAVTELLSFFGFLWLSAKGGFSQGPVSVFIRELRVESLQSLPMRGLG